MFRVCSIKLCGMWHNMTGTGNDTIKIGTRGSKLALWQANWVKSAIEATNPALSAELVVIKTKGDKILDVPLAKVGGKGLFVKEIEEALLDGRIDLAIHSMKDMPAEIPKGLTIGAIPERENPRDVLISNSGKLLSELKPGAKVGTSSLRRSSQLKINRPDVEIIPLRGNIDTRLKKVASGDYDAIILAAAGMLRLGFDDRITEFLDETVLLPAVGQGALCIEIRENDPRIAPLVEKLNDHNTSIVVTGERAFLHRLEGSCQIPVAAYGQTDGTSVTLTGLVADLDGTVAYKETITGANEESAQLGIQLAETLLSKGAKKILDQLKESDNEIG